MTSTETKFKHTAKVRGNLTTVHGDDITEFVNNIESLKSAIPSIHELEDTIAEYANGNHTPAARAAVTQAFPQAQPVQAPASHNYPPQAPQGGWGGPNATPEQQRYAAQVPQAPPAPSCDHGLRTFKSGVGNNGKKWSAYFCSAPKGAPDQCDPIWG